MKAKTSARDKGIFVRHNVDFVPKGSLTHLRVQNELMLLVLSGRKLQHIRLQNGKTTDIPVPLSEQERVANIFLDYNGAHAIVSTTTGENFYVNMRSVQLKPLKRFKGTVTAVGWNLEYSRERETGFIVLGTNKGQLTETNISANGTMAYVKTLVNDVSEDKAFAVTDLQMHQQSEDTSDRWILLVCTTGRLYVLAGAVDIKAATQPQPQPVVGTVWSAVMVEQPGGVLQPLFSNKEPPPFLSLNSEKHIPPSELAVYPIVSSEPPKYYCWLSSEGLRLGSIDVAKAGKGTEMLAEEAQLEHKRVEGRFDYPLDVAMTEYHLLMLHSDRFVAVSRLNQKTAFEDNFDAKTIALGMCRDASSQFIWVFTESAIFKYRPFDETRHVWRIYLERNEFAKAQVITSQMQDPGPYQIVIKKEAEKFIAEKNFAAAAELLAQSTDPFENTVLMFLRDGTSKEGRMGLKRFLELKLNPMNRSEDKIKRDILVIWLLEIQLGELAELRRSRNQAVASGQPEQSSMSTSRDAELKKLRHELSSFLNRPIVYESISENRAAIYRLITSHADFETQLNLATKLKDYPVAIKVHMLTKNYAEALKLLASHGNAKLFYEYAPDLMQEVPGELVAVLIEKERMMRPSEILPAFYGLVHNEDGLKGEERTKKAPDDSGRMVDAAFKYLQHVIESGRADQNVHDFTVKLYAKYKPNALLEHLKKFGKSRADVPYDVSAALRICGEK
ncbi:Protein VPS-18, partial [Aphelenchoides avenae]